MRNHAKTINQKFYYGWLIVLTSAIAMFFSAPGQTFSVSVFIDAYGETFDYSSTLISTGYSVATVISGSLIVFMGRLVDKFGHRVMMVVVGILLALTTFYNSFVANIGMMFVGFFLLRYFGQGSMTLLPESLVPQWFDKRRGFALSIMGLGITVATLLVPRYNLFLIDQFGWQGAWRVWSLMLLLILVPMAFFFVINRPEKIGITIENAHNGNKKAADEAYKAMMDESFTLKEAVKTRQFWFVGLMSMIGPMFTTGVTFHFFSIMALRGVERETSAFIIGLIAVPAFIMPLIARSVVDRLPFKVTFLIIQTIFMLSMVWLAFAVTGAPSATFFILFYGIGFTLLNVTMNAMWPSYFGRAYLGAIRGAGTVFMVIGSALGALPFGVSYDVTGNYNAAIFVMMGMTGVAMVLASLLRKPQKHVQSLTE
ncbi:MAG: MFS transporter [Bacillota bacterium]